MPQGPQGLFNRYQIWLQMRGLGSGAAATANWLTNAVVSHTFLPLTQALGGSGTFWIYAAITACGTAWAYLQLPETKGVACEPCALLGRLYLAARGLSSLDRGSQQRMWDRMGLHAAARCQGCDVRCRKACIVQQHTL